MILAWNQEHGAIFRALVNELKKENIRYFVLRNYEGLPEVNSSKDVDIIIEPGKLKKARCILLSIYKQAGLQYYYETIFGRVHCMLGMNEEKEFSIHIDLIEGYLSKGYEIFTFEDLYSHTTWYREICVMDSLYEGVMIYIYKQFGYTKPKLKDEYKECIFRTYQNYKAEFQSIVKELTDSDFAEDICKDIANEEFDLLLRKAPQLTKKLRSYVWRSRPISTLKNTISFFVQKVIRIIFNYKKHVKSFAVMAPDGAGKTTFLEILLDQLNFYYVNKPEDYRFHVYHFRPTLLPNLGEVGEKAGVMKQDKNFTDPHRSKPANPLSSLVRITYYTLDYIVGWQKCVRNDVHYDRYSVFDRYSYDLIVDPRRTKLNLPMWVRKFFVALTPQPKIVFLLNAEPEVIYARKQELTLEEITRQIGEYRKVANSNAERFIIINAEQTPQQMAKEAIRILLKKYTVRL